MSNDPSFIAQIAHSSSLFATGVYPITFDVTLVLIGLRAGVLYGRKEAITIPHHR
jgi:hypothetical protein